VCHGAKSAALVSFSNGAPSALIGTFQSRVVVVMHWVVLPVLPRRRVALPDRATSFAGQTKTPDLLEARGAQIAQRQDQPTIRQTPGHREIDTARRACRIFMSCLLSAITRTADPASFTWRLGDPSRTERFYHLKLEESTPMASISSRMKDVAVSATHKKIA
jgi:hypothetical protein